MKEPTITQMFPRPPKGTTSLAIRRELFTRIILPRRTARWKQLLRKNWPYIIWVMLKSEWDYRRGKVFTTLE